MKRIIYKQENNNVAIIVPSQSALDKYGIEAIGIKDVPEEKKFWIVDVKDMPENRTFRNAWELDEKALGKHDGIGGKGQEFSKEIKSEVIENDNNK